MIILYSLDNFSLLQYDKYVSFPKLGGSEPGDATAPGDSWPVCGLICEVDL